MRAPYFFKPSATASSNGPLPAMTTRLPKRCSAPPSIGQSQYATILAGMTLPGRDIANAPVVMLFVVPVGG